MEISNMINSKIKVMVIKILTGFEERKKKRKYKKEPLRDEELNN